MKRLLITVSAAAALSVFGEAPSAKPAEQGVRNPFWPIGYEGVRETISPEVRAMPTPVTNVVKTATERAADAKAAAAKAAADKAAAEKAAKEKAEREAAARAEAERKKREITSAHWSAARATLKFGGRVKLREDDAIQSTSVVINGKVYADGDYVSITHDSRRFTWRVDGLTDHGTLKLVRVRAKYIEKPGDAGKQSSKGENK